MSWRNIYSSFLCASSAVFPGKGERAFMFYGADLIYFIQTPGNLRAPPWAGLGVPMVWPN